MPRHFLPKATWVLSILMIAAVVLGAAPPARAQAPSPDNSAKYHEWLTREVRHRLVLLPYYSVFDNLEYKVSGSKVTLQGQVTQPSLKDDAAAAVKKIEGVSGVVNNIEVLPLSGNDDRIRRDVFRAVYESGPLEKYELQAVPPIHIIVKNGHVTLVGVVDSEMDKNLANVKASGVPGAFSVTNNLIVAK
jgi:hyperosmotically inducible protein